MAPVEPRDAHERRRAMAERVLGHGDLLDARVLEALRKVPRERFLPEEAGDAAFEDHAMPIGEGQTISAPHMVAIMCTLLDLRPGHRVLEVGTGSGYHAAVMAHLVRPGGHVWSIEMIPRLAGRAVRALKEAGYGDLVEVRVGDGAEGADDEAPFDRISVAAASPEVPAPLLDQLSPGGRLVIPVGDRECVLTSVDRTEAGLRRREHGRCVFVPLTGAYGLERGTGSGEV